MATSVLPDYCLLYKITAIRRANALSASRIWKAVQGQHVQATRRISNDRTGTESCDAQAPAARVDVVVSGDEVCCAFGVRDAKVATRLLDQIVNVMHSGANAVESADIKVILSLMGEIAPTNGVEAMTATLLVATQHAAADAMRRALHPDQTPGGRAMYMSLALKAARTYAQLLEALNQGRGKGVVRQEIIVQHVTVESGAQAIVAPISQGRG